MAPTTRPPKDALKVFALKLRRARVNTLIDGKPMTQRQAAKLIGVGFETYRRWEVAQHYPLAQHMSRIAAVLGVADDEAWLDTGSLPPDIHEFLVTTREGLRVVQNIRSIMEAMRDAQQPTHRRGFTEFSQMDRRTRYETIVKRAFKGQNHERAAKARAESP